MAAELRLDGSFTGSAASCRLSAHSNLPYLAVLLCWPMITKGQLRPLLLLGVATVLAAKLYPGNIYLTGHLAAFVFALKYIFS